MSKAQELVFELLLISTGPKQSLSHPYTDKEWEEALDIANDQAILGVMMMAMEEFEDKAQLPSKPVLLQWIGNCQIVEQNTQMLDDAAQKVVKFLHKHGFACQILKGSAVARYYPQPLRRTSGDVDVWGKGSRSQIYEFARKQDPAGKLYDFTYHHVGLKIIPDVHVELHIWPSFLSSPLRNHRLHTFFGLHRPTMESDMPSLAFDRVFILLHCYRHMCGYGVGLRQIMDYFYVLKQGFTEEEQKDSVYWIKQLGMKRFAGGIMWVLQHYFGLEEKFLLMAPDEKEGRFILSEVMQTGNMGHSDSRNWGSTATPLSRFFLNIRRNIYLVKHCPHEVLWAPFFSMRLFFWRLTKLRK